MKKLKRSYLTKKPKRRRYSLKIFKNKLFWISFLFLLVSTLISYFFILGEFFQIKEINIHGAEANQEGEIKEFIGERIKNKFLIWETKSIFLVNKDKISSDILNSYPTFKDVKLEKVLPSRMNVTLYLRKEIGTFCKEENCFLLDDTGVVFQPVTDNINRSFPIFNNYLFNLTLYPRQKVFEKKSLDIIMEVAKVLKDEMKITPLEISLISQQRFNIKTSEGWEIYFSLVKDLASQLLSLRTVLEKGITPEHRERLHYIDLRFDKVFVSP